MTAFITRDLAPDSDFRQILTEQGWSVAGQSLVTLTPLPFGVLPMADWLFFTSRNAVRFFFEHLHTSHTSLFSFRWAALGESTAKALKERGVQVDFVGTGDPATTAAAFRPAFSSLEKGTPGTILFPSARHSQQSLFTLLSSDFQCTRLEVYDNLPISDPPAQAADALVFTSPLNAEAYFTKNPLHKKQRVFAIGHTTAAALSLLGISKVTVAEEATEKGLAAAVLGVFASF